MTPAMTTVLSQPPAAAEPLPPPGAASPDAPFDRLTQLAATALGTSAAFISLADPCIDAIAFRGLTGLPEIPAGHRLPLSSTICRYVVASGRPLAVEDRAAHSLARDEPILRDLGIEAYLGIPLTSESGMVVGVLCGVERFPRRWSDAEIEIAEGIAAAVMTELDLRSTEHRYRSLIENLPLVTYMNTVEEPVRTVFMSPQIESLLGYTAEEWLAQPDFISAGIHPEDRAFAHEMSHRARLHGEPTRCEYRLLARDGREVWVLDQTTPVRDADGEIVGYQGFLLDITQHKRLEEQLRQSQKLEAIGQLAGGIAHDFNNMLTAIGGYADLLASSFEPDDPRADDVEQIRRASGHAAALTRNLLSFGRKQVLRPQQLDLNEVVREVQGMLSRTLGDDVTLVTQFSPALPLVAADPDQLTQVVVNVALNGRDAMPNGGELLIRTRSLELDGSAFVAVEIADTGIGMDEATRNRVFEPFFSTKAKGKGTGLGLSTAYGFVSQRGGRIEIESEPGAGSVFRVLLPAV